nr:uncharacterized protein LOC106145837 [Columba livia]
MRRRKASPNSRGALRAPSGRGAGSDMGERFTHSQVAQGMSQQEPACCRASSQEDESLVLIVSGSLALALVSLQRYLSTCVSTVKEMVQTRSGLLMFFCFICVAATAGAFCGTSLPMWMLWAKDVPQVLLEKPVGELKSLRNSLALLREQAQEVQQLKKDLTRLTAEMSSLKTEIEDLRMAMSAMPVEESVQMSAWALKSTGVTIDLQRSQRSFTWPCRLFWFLCDLRPQETFVQLDISPGYCWPFQASGSQVVVTLPAQVQPTAITVQHPLKKSSALGDTSSAPRDFTVSGLDEEGKEETLLGTFSYDIKKAPAQTFPLQSELPRAFQRIRLLIQSNWGKSRYTCIYRVQVHGKVNTDKMRISLLDNIKNGYVIQDLLSFSQKKFFFRDRDHGWPKCRPNNSHTKNRNSTAPEARKNRWLVQLENPCYERSMEEHPWRSPLLHPRSQKQTVLWAASVAPQDCSQLMGTVLNTLQMTFPR